MPAETLRRAALSIFQTALEAAHPRAAMYRALQRDGNRLRVEDRKYDLAEIRRVFVIGFGKASAAMAQAAEEILSDRIAGGWVTVKYGHTAPLHVIRLHEAGHPLLDQNSLLGTEKILELLAGATERDLILCLISGGGSALLELPVEGITLDDLRVMTDVMLRSGATINELNTVRKHVSQVKGGQLARRAGGAKVISLILSDVIGSPLDTIASGPTAPDSTSFGDALDIISHRNLLGQLPSSIIRHIERGASGQIADTPKASDVVFSHVQNVIIADNGQACQAAVAEASRQGYNTLLLTTYIQGEARQVAKVFAAIADEIVHSNNPVHRPACVIAGGETTVTVQGQGKGGRNQELVLAGAIEIAGMESPQIIILSGGTDGTDGPTDAAGAMADGTTVSRASAQGMDARAYLANNDAYHFFRPLDDLIMTGPTQTNVNDIILLLIG